MRKKRFLLISALVLTVALLWVLWGNLTVGLTRVTIQEENLPSSFHGLKIAHVSDLHNCDLWKQTLRKLKRAKPDLICITGDLVDGNRTDVDVALSFVAEAVQIAPCYYVIGNHETCLESRDLERLFTGLEELGVTVLEDEAVYLQRGDDKILIFGNKWRSDAYRDEIAEFDGFRLLLAHDPAEFENYATAGFDLVLSGHIHGGQFRIPFMGGLYSPSDGWFPYSDAGHFRYGHSDLYISRGIGNSRFPLRLNNRPEVILITLQT